MIQFNLLPDVKREYIKARRTKHLIVMGSLVISSASIAVVVLLFGVVQGAQKKNITDLTADITKKISSIEAIPDIKKILTVQNQDKSLIALHEANPRTSRIFDFLGALTPASVTISRLDLNMVDSIIKIEGSAKSFANINQFADTVKFATYDTDGVKGSIAFTNVTTQLSRNQETASYVLSFSFDPVLFKNTENVSLVVPKKITTRSSIGSPSIEVFDQPTDSSGGTN